MPSPSTIVRGNGPRDGLPDYIVQKLKRDENGALIGTVLRHFKVGAVNQRINPAWLSPLSAPDPGWGVPCKDAEAEVRDSLAIVTYYFEGLDPNNPPIADETTYELDTVMGSKSVKTHPAYAVLKSKYGWDDELGCFPEYAPGAGDPLQGGFQGPTQPKRSPLAGVSDWFFVGVTYRISYVVAASAVPTDLLASIGTIISAPRGIGQFQLPAASKKRNWLVMAPKAVKRGNSTQITEEYQLGEPGGFQKEIYSASQLGEKGGNTPGSGLTTGSL